MSIKCVELWNQKEIRPPATNTYKIKGTDIDVQLFKNILEEAVEFYTNQQHLHNEAALLSRCIYRMKMKFRNSKDLKSLEKLNKCLLNYLLMDVEKNINNLYLLTPDHTSISLYTYLPTKNVVDYILVRLQGLAKLMTRTVETTKLSAYYYQDRIKLGHFWNLAVVAYSLVSRIYITSMKIAKYTCDLYTKLLVFSNKLKNTGENWLPVDYTFPKDLKDWLGVEWIHADDNIIEILDETNPILQFIDFTQDSDDSIEFCNEYFMINDKDDTDFTDNYQDLTLRRNSTGFKGANRFTSGIRGFGVEDIDVGDVINDSVQITDEYYDLCLADESNFNNFENLGKRSNNKQKTQESMPEIVSIDDSYVNENSIIVLNDTMENSLKTLNSKKQIDDIGEAFNMSNKTSNSTLNNAIKKKKNVIGSRKKKHKVNQEKLILKQLKSNDKGLTRDKTNKQKKQLKKEKGLLDAKKNLNIIEGNESKNNPEEVYKKVNVENDRITKTRKTKNKSKRNQDLNSSKPESAVVASIKKRVSLESVGNSKSQKKTDKSQHRMNSKTKRLNKKVEKLNKLKMKQENAATSTNDTATSTIDEFQRSNQKPKKKFQRYFLGNPFE